MSEQQDWTRAYLLMAKDGSGNIIPLLVDASGQMYALLRGIDALGAAQTVKIDADGQLYTVLRGAAGVDVAVDAAGFLSAVLKANYAGSLVTVAADSPGRLSAFVVDSSDVWNQIVTIGNAELAARLGSPVLYHQSGRVLFIESFEYGLQRWSTLTSGTGSSVALDPTTYESAGYSCRLTAGSTPAYLASICSQFGARVAGKCGLALSFARSAVFDTLTINFLVRDGATLHYAGVRLDQDNAQIQVRTGDAIFTSVGTLALPDLGVGIWIHLKFTFDIVTNLYSTVYLNDASFDASAQPMHTTPSTADPALYAEIVFVGNSGDNDAVCIDNVILTGSEP